MAIMALRPFLRGGFVFFFLGAAAVLVGLPTTARAADYHHVHLIATSAPDGVAWYMQHMGCTALPRPDACIIGDTQLIFFNREPTDGSVGTGVDHIGFSFRDLDARMQEWEAAGVTILSPARDIQGLFKLAFVEDPWGTKIEVVQDTEYLGFHHIHLSSNEPAAVLAWYQNIFGGESDSLKGRIDGLRYGTVWLLVSGNRGGGELGATQGRAIDHLGFSFPDLDAAAAEIRGKGVEFQMEPRPYTNAAGQDMKISFVVGPDGVRIEVVQPEA